MNKAKEYIIYCDESIEKGSFYSDFYGGVLISSTHLDIIQLALNIRKQELNLNREIKWSRVTRNYLDKYKAMMDIFFEYIHVNQIKARVMFRHNINQKRTLSKYDRTHGYFLLYYQFIKHAFGLKYSNSDTNQPIYIRTFFDELPDSKEKAELFKNHIFALQSLKDFEAANLKIRRRDINEIDSKNHVILQCLDVVLGAIAFRLNRMHKQKPKGQYRRGNRTIAKEELYKYIYKKICLTYPNFNIGITTGTNGKIENIWKHPYRHWSFMPKNSTKVKK